LLNFSNDIKTKALVLFLATTGCRIGETVQIKLDNVDLDKRQVKILPSISKTHRLRYVFFTEETKQVLNQWLKVRTRYLKTKKKKSTFVINDKDDGRLFPFSKDNAKKIWNRLLERAGSPFNEKDHNEKFVKPRYLYHLHTLRKHWFSAFQNTQANWNHINFIGGHESLLTASYSNLEKNPDLLKKTYDSFSSCLTIFEAQPDLSETHREIQRLKKQIDKQNEMLELIGISRLDEKIYQEVQKQLSGKRLFDKIKKEK
jgi:integrase